MPNPRIAPYLLDDLWQALLKINDHINALHIVQLSSECFEKKSRLTLCSWQRHPSGILLGIRSEAD